MTCSATDFIIIHIILAERIIDNYTVVDMSRVCDLSTEYLELPVYTVKTLNIGTPRPATVVVLNIKQFNFTRK